MNEINKEIEYFNTAISSIVYKKRFKVMFGENKVVFGVLSANEPNNPMMVVARYKTIYDTIINLDKNIKFSFEQAIQYSYSENIGENFSLLSNNNSQEEFLAYYFIENALFRTSTLWDMLAQLYNVFFELGIPNDQVYYKKIFDTNKTDCSKYFSEATNIMNYINQADNIETTDIWEGNHQYVNGLRNQMTHRNSPNVATASDFDFNLKDYPTYQLKRIIEDYVVVSKFLNEILDEIEISIIAKLETEK